MKLKHRWSRTARELSIADAVEVACLEDGDRDGELERVSAQHRETAELIGRLVEQLHASRALSDEAVAAILGHGFDVIQN